VEVKGGSRWKWWKVEVGGSRRWKQVDVEEKRKRRSRSCIRKMGRGVRACQGIAPLHSQELGAVIDAEGHREPM
jgi:hypothetical protein